MKNCEFIIKLLEMINVEILIFSCILGKLGGHKMETLLLLVI